MIDRSLPSFGATLHIVHSPLMSSEVACVRVEREHNSLTEEGARLPSRRLKRCNLLNDFDIGIEVARRCVVVLYGIVYLAKPIVTELLNSDRQRAVQETYATSSHGSCIFFLMRKSSNFLVG